MKPSSLRTPSLAFKPLDRWGETTWTRPENFSFLNGPSSIPAAGTELLQVAHQYPLAVRHASGSFWVEALTAQSLLRHPVADEAGRLTRPYSLIAVRCLPFRMAEAVGSNSAGELELAAEFAGGQAGKPLREADGTLSADVQRVERLLTTAAESQEELSAAAELLFLADLLVPLVISGSTGDQTDYGSLLTLDRARLSELSREKLSAVVGGGLLVIDLIAALSRSADHFKPDAVTTQKEVWRGSFDSPGLSDLDWLIKNVSRVEFELDASDLFSLDRLDAGEAPLGRR